MAKTGSGKISNTMIARARLEAGISQEEVAKITLVSVRTLQNWEQGRPIPAYIERWLLKEYDEIRRRNHNMGGYGSEY